MNEFHLTSINKEHTRSQGYHRIYVSFPVSKINKKDTLLSPLTFYSWLPSSLKADIYFLDYKKFKKPTYEQLEDSFVDIEMMVVLVDKEVLDGNYINDLEMQVAEDKKIPILPILMDTRHIALFNQVFNHKQCLVYRSKDGKDNFIEKVEKYSIKYLEGGMSYNIKDIVDIFTPPIFLSYRKKDKQHLRQFLYNLHEDEGLVPYSFWYDDFLNPGINYDEEIKEVLDKSNVFVLFITKNIFEEGNYVLDIEYPYAVNNKKIIIGVTYGNFDKSLIKKHFPELTKIFKYTDIDGIANALLNVLPSHNIYSPENEYLLAQAYYYGFNVEKNKNIALNYFNSSFDAGEKRSAKYLAYTYYNNDMTASDILQACHYQEIYVDFISSKGEDFKKSVDEKRTLIKYQLDAFDYNNALTNVEALLKTCPMDASYYLDVFLDRIEVLLKFVPVNETILDNLNVYKDKINNLESEEECDVLLSLRIRYLYALYYFNIRDYESARSYISIFNDICFQNYIFATLDNIYLSANTLYLLAKTLEELGEEEKAKEAYINAFIFGSFDESLSLNGLTTISLYKSSLGEEEKEEAVNSYLSTTSYLAMEDRTRFDNLYAYFLSESEDLFKNIEALYLYERYTQLHIDTFIDEKINLYYKLFTYFTISGIEELTDESKQLTLLEFRAISYLISDSLFPINLLVREIFLREIKDVNDEEIKTKKMLLETLLMSVPNINIDIENLDEYRDTQNDLFFLDREQEELDYPVEEFDNYSFLDEEFDN